MKKLLFFSLLAISLGSCKKENEPTTTNQNANFKVEIVLSGAISDYTEMLTTSLITDEGQSANLLGEEWKTGERVQSSTVTNYTQIGTPRNRALTTKESIKNVYLSQVMAPIKPNPQKLTSTVTIYRNGVVTTTKTKVFDGSNDNSFLVY